jgi:hypothetical protein
MLKKQGRPVAVVPESETLTQAGQGMPVLRLLAAVANESALLKASPGAVLLSPGGEDRGYGTPLALYRRAVHALVSHLELTYDRRNTDVALVLPALSPVQIASGEPYRQILREVAEARHLNTLDLADILTSTSFGTGGEHRYPDAASQKRAAEAALQTVDFARRQSLVHLIGLVLMVGVLAFAFSQWLTHRRLTRLVAVSCTRPDGE